MTRSADLRTGVKEVLARFAPLNLRDHLETQHKPPGCRHCESLGSGEMRLDFGVVRHPHPRHTGGVFYHYFGCGKYS
jgi:hypothetical protein